MQKIVLSIIIPTYNCIEKIEKTVNSVINQSYKNWELIIVDGQSTDGTYEYIRKNYNSFCTCITEKDKGIYDAMNKGIKLAKGNWFYFINAGDYLIDNYVLEKVAVYFQETYTLIYGGYKIYFSNNTNKLISPKPLSTIPYDMPSCHQSLFYHQSLFKNVVYNIKHPWCADHIHLAELFRLGELMEKKLDIPIVFFEAGGEIGRNAMDFIRDRILVAKSFLPLHKVIIYYLKMIWYIIIRKTIKQILIK